MRVLMTADSAGGVWTYALGLAKRFATQGVRTILATTGGPLSDTHWVQAGENPALTLHESGFRFDWMQMPKDDLQAVGAWLLELEHRVRPNVVHLNNYLPDLLPWRAPVVLVGHSCIFSWWHAVRGGPPPVNYERYETAVRNSLNASAAVIAPTRFMLDELTRHYGHIPHAEVIHNGADENLFQPGNKEPLVLSVGRLWDEAKNVQAAIEAAEHFEWPLLLAGDTHHPEGWAVDLGGVRHLGNLAPGALARWYAAAAIYLFPARYEPFGLSVLEAALSGCALVLGDIASLRELWGEAALFVPPDDHTAVAAAVNRLAADPELRRTMGTRARTAALSFTINRCADAYLHRYATLCAVTTAHGC